MIDGTLGAAPRNLTNIGRAPDSLISIVHLQQLRGELRESCLATAGPSSQEVGRQAVEAGKSQLGPS